MNLNEVDATLEQSSAVCKGCNEMPLRVGYHSMVIVSVHIRKFRCDANTISEEREGKSGVI